MKKNLNAAKPPEQSKGLGGNIIGCRGQNLYIVHGIKRVSQCITCGQQYIFGEKPTLMLYTDINHHIGTPKQNTKHYQVPGMNLDVQSIVK